MSDELLDRATRALAQETDATGEPDDATLARILDSLEAADEGSGTTSRRSWVSLAAAAALSLAIIAGGPTAWAWSVGVLQSLWGAPAVDSEPLPDAPPVASETATTPRAATPTPTITPIVSTPSETAVDESPAPVRARRRRIRPAPQAAFDPAIRAERELFETAHRLHFGGPGSESTLEAWDAYLSAYPGGRYVPEARYNRALTLVRLGRTSAARRALEDLSTSGYRAPEAMALLDAMESP